MTAQEFILERTFDAPRALVWNALTNQKQLAMWWGPPGMQWVHGTNELRPGGTFHFGMRSPEGQTMWGKWVYITIDPPQRLEFLNSFADANGNSVRAPFSANWPMEVRNVLTLEQIDHSTRLTLRSAPENASEEDRATFAASFASLQHGFGGTFDRLDSFLHSSAKDTQ